MTSLGSPLLFFASSSSSKMLPSCMSLWQKTTGLPTPSKVSFSHVTSLFKSTSIMTFMHSGTAPLNFFSAIFNHCPIVSHSQRGSLCNGTWKRPCGCYRQNRTTKKKSFFFNITKQKSWLMLTCFLQCGFWQNAMRTIMKRKYDLFFWFISFSQNRFFELNEFNFNYRNETTKKHAHFSMRLCYVFRYYFF